MLEKITEEVHALLEHPHCPWASACAESNYGSEVRCDDHVMCPQFKNYVNIYVDHRLSQYAQGIIQEDS